MLLDRSALAEIDAPLQLSDGSIRWHVGGLPRDFPVYLQALQLDPSTGRISLSDVRRLDARQP